MAKQQDYIRYLNDDRIEDFFAVPALAKLLQTIQEDKEQRFQLEVRQNYVTVYYNGGKLSNFKKDKSGKYVTDFDLRYCDNQDKESVNREKIISIGSRDIDGFVNNLETYTAEMDAWFLKHPKAERANQQIICKKFRMPNDLLWLVDIEFVIEKSRFDMLAVDSDGNVKLIELKVGNNALSSRPQNGSNKLQSGLYKHYLDFLRVKQRENFSKAVIQSAGNIIRVRKRLGLPTFEGRINTDIHSIVFEIWLADYLTKGTILSRELKDIEVVGGSADMIKINPDYLSEIKKNYR